MNTTDNRNIKANGISLLQTGHWFLNMYSGMCKPRVSKASLLAF